MTEHDPLHNGDIHVSAPERRVSCSASPVGCLLWLGIFALAVWLVLWVAAMWGAR